MTVTVTVKHDFKEWPPITETDPKLFQFLKWRTEQYVAEGLPYCDEKMIPIIKSLYKHSDIVPIFSCQGHPPGRGDRGKWCVGYMMFGFTNGAPILIKLIDYINRAMSAEIKRNAPFVQLETSFAQNAFKHPDYLNEQPPAVSELLIKTPDTYLCSTIRNQQPYNRQGMNAFMRAFYAAARELEKD